MVSYHGNIPDTVLLQGSTNISAIREAYTAFFLIPKK